MTRLDVLDGVRGIAILMVIFGHMLDGGSWECFGLLSGYAGVAIFFVLSGFLITRGLLVEEDREGSLNLPRFYFRRMIRIWPAFYTFLLGMWILSLLKILPASPPDTLWLSALHLRNVWGEGWQTGHLWSLALEEQFYFLWPLLLVMMPRRRRLALTVVIAGLFCLGRLLFLPSHTLIEGLYSRPELRLDTFMIGGLVAMLPSVRIGKRLAVWSAAILFLWMTAAPTITRAFDTPVSACLIAISLKWLIENPHDSLAQSIAGKPLRPLGRISYTVYLWQQLFFGPPGALILGLPWTYVLFPLAVFCSYRFVELPSLRWKSELTAHWDLVHATPGAGRMAIQ